MLIDETTVTTLQEMLAEDFTDILHSFFDSSRESLALLQKAVMDQAHEEIMQLAHGLKGSGNNVGAVQLAEACLALEQCAKDGGAENLASHLERITRAYDATERALRAYL